MHKVYQLKTRFGFSLRELEAEKITPHKVKIQNTMYNKVSDGVQFFDDFKQAKERGLKYLTGQIERLQMELQTLEGQLKVAQETTPETIQKAVKPC